MSEVVKLEPFSRDWRMAYVDAILQCKLRYRQMISNCGVAIDGEQALLNFLDEFKPDVPLVKLSRWLGYVQGKIIAEGLTTVEEEREWTRPLFRPLDFP
jgi:ubiquinone biosynthesis protein UbiJ